MKNQTVRAFKGFEQNLSCRGHQFQVGQTYEHDGPVAACRSGFHACTDPRDVFAYYAPGTSRFCEVELSGETAGHEDDSKIAAQRIRIVREIGVSGMVAACVAYAADNNTPEGETATGYSGSASATGTSGSASATGYRGSASATGYRGSASATGTSGSASATGDYGSASATGYSGSASATGAYGVAVAAGYGCSSAGAEGCALFLTERGEDGIILNVWAGIVGKDGVEAGVAYTLRNGKPEAVL